MRTLWRRLRHFTDRTRLESDLRDEIETHRSLRQTELERAGMPPQQAERLSRRALGNVVLAREDARGAWVTPWLESVWQDVRYGANSLQRQPAFALSAVTVLALGIGLTTMLAAFGYATFFRPWDVPDADRVAVIRSRMVDPGTDHQGISVSEFQYLQKHVRGLSHLTMTAWRASETLSDSERQLGRVQPLYVSEDYVGTLRLRLLAGRDFTPGDNDSRAPAAVAILSDGLWRDRFQRDPAVVGRHVRIGAHSFLVVGIAAGPAFRDATDGVRGGFDVVAPLAATTLGGLSEGDGARADARLVLPFSSLIGRLREDASHLEVAAELTSLSRQFRAAEGLPALVVTATDTRPLARRGLRDAWQIAQLVFLGLVLVQLVACANVGNMLLARGLARRREIAIRVSLGGGRARIVRQLVTEAVVLSLAAGAAASALPLALPVLMRWLDISELERPEYYAPDAPVFWLAFGMALMTALACGLAPALRVTRLNVASVASARHGQGAGGVRLRRVLLATQVALSTVLLTGAGLLTKALDRALSVDPGFAFEQLQVIDVRLPAGPGLLERHARVRLALEHALARSELPPVALTNEPPWSASRAAIFLRHPHDRQGPRHRFWLQGVSSNYFTVTGIGMLAGRPPRGDDDREIAVSESVARRLWGSENPIGKTVLNAWPGVESPTLHQVVGLVKDVAVRTPGEIEPVVYGASRSARPALLVRDLSPAIVERLRSIVISIDPQAEVAARSLPEHARDALFLAVAGGRVAWGIGGLALLLSTVGAFGVFAYAVEERRREIGVRIALGARGSQVVRVVMAHAQRTVLTGLAAGVALAALLVPLLRTFLYGLSAFDPIVYIQTAAMIALGVAAATWIPARRATRVDPAVTLRSD